METIFKKNVRLCCLLILFLGSNLLMCAQDEYRSKLPHIEEDGFVWYYCFPKKGKYTTAVGVNGKTIIPLSQEFSHFEYKKGLLSGMDTKKAKAGKNYNGYFTKSGRPVHRPGEFEYIILRDQNDGFPPFLLVKRNGLYGAYDLFGNQVLEFVSYSWPQYTEDGFKIKKSKKGEFEQTGILLPGADLKKASEKEIKSGNDGYVWTEIRNEDLKYGALNQQCEYIIPMLYKEINYIAPVNEDNVGFFEVTTFNGCKGIYGTDGEVLVSELESYSKILPLEESFFIVENDNGETGIYDTFIGELIAPGEYDEITWDGESQIFNVEKAGKYGAIDCIGRVLIEPKYPYPLKKADSGLGYIDNNEFIYVYDREYLSDVNVVESKFKEALTTPDYYKALRVYNSVIDLDPVNKYGYLGPAFNNIGILRCNNGDYYSAETAFKSASAAEPGNEDYKNNIAIAKDNYRKNQMTGLKLVSALLDVASQGIEGYSNIKSQRQNRSSISNTSNKKTGASGTSKKSTGNAFAHAVNENTARDTYNKYVGQLQEMKTFWETRYNSMQRKQIQSNMKKIREEWGFPKSEWEDWDGSL